MQSTTADALCWDVLTAYPEEYRTLSLTPSTGIQSLDDRSTQWRVETASGSLNLRRREKSTISTNRLQFSQAVLWNVLQESEGGRVVLLPLETNEHRGYVEQDNAYWELMPHVEGNPIGPNDLNIESICASMLALAELHLASESFPIAEEPRSTSPGIRQMRDQLNRQWGSRVPTLMSSVATCSNSSRYHAAAARILEAAPQLIGNVMTLLSRSARLPVILQPSLKHLTRENVYLEERDLAFFGNLLEFGVDNASRDISQLLGSLAQNNHWLWVAGLNAYQLVRSLNDNERYLIVAFDRASHLMEGLDWLDRIFDQQETFEPDYADRVELRLTEIANRLDFFVQVLKHPKDTPHLK